MISERATPANQTLALLGATGSIGFNTLKLLRMHPQRYQLFGVSAHANVALLLQIIIEFRPEIAVVGTADAANLLRTDIQRLNLECAVEVGPGALCELASAPQVDTVIAAIVGAAGLPSTLAAAQAGKRLLLANKESLVIGGALVIAAAEKSGALILPVDSEHNAIFQCLPHTRPIPLGVKKLWLTASGGPFRGFTQGQLDVVTPAQAIAHPNWQMGRKISVDSATLMNKGLEVIEAHWLFGFSAEDIDVVVHPQSVVHSLVEYIDGSFLAQLGSPDMCTPIAYALAFPERIASGVQTLNPLKLMNLSFEPPDHARFPCLRIAFDALTTGASAPVILNAANEVAVACFLNEQLRFVQIPQIINECLQRISIQSLTSLAQVLEIDASTRQFALELVKKLV
jgi:1-deoxy-D-xylulose-5-phosphate reductoisomerase